MRPSVRLRPTVCVAPSVVLFCFSACEEAKRTFCTPLLSAVKK